MLFMRVYAVLCIVFKLYDMYNLTHW